MSSPSAEPTGPGPLEVQVLQAKEVSIPIAVGPGAGGGELPPEVMKMRADFLAGRQLSREQMGELMRQSTESGSGGGGNGNCNIC